jgi:hypothetical protein
MRQKNALRQALRDAGLVHISKNGQFELVGYDEDDTHPFIYFDRSERGYGKCNSFSALVLFGA